MVLGLSNFIFSSSFSRKILLPSSIDAIISIVLIFPKPLILAKELIVSVHTAKAHVCSILQKMCVNDRVQAAVKAVKEGLV